MALADDHPPFSSTDFDGHPVGQPLKTRRHRGNTAAIALFPLAEELDRRRVEPGMAGGGAGGGGRKHHHSGSPPRQQPSLFSLPTSTPPAARPARLAAPLL